MCSNCENILHEYPFAHNGEHCPLAAASYCGLCCKFGHLDYVCVNRPAKNTDRKPLGPKIVTENSDTLRASFARAKAQQLTAFQRTNKNYFEITKNDQVMERFLFSQKESIAGKTQELCKKIETWAKKMNYDGVRFL
jgi:hypothetical protein